VRKKFISTIFVAIFFCGFAVSFSAFSQIENEFNLVNNNSEIKDLAGVSSLMSAAAENDVEGVKFFTKAGSKTINKKNIGGGTALLIASRNGNLQIAKMLIETGADVNLSDNEGFTPLMRAAIAKSPELTMLLINNRANIFLTNINNESAMVHATASDCDACLAQILLSAKSSNQKASNDFLLKQLMISFSVAQNRQNDNTKNLLQKYLDEMSKSTSIAGEVTDNDNGFTEVKEDIDVAANKAQEFVNKDKGVKYVFGDSSQKINTDKSPIIKAKEDAPQSSAKESVSKFANEGNVAVRFKFVSGAAPLMPAKKAIYK